MDTQEKYIELNAFLKLKGFAGTGGKAKLLIRDGHARVNGAIETRNKRKLYAGDKVSIDGKDFTVEKGILKQH